MTDDTLADGQPAPMHVHWEVLNHVVDRLDAEAEANPETSTYDALAQYVDPDSFVLLAENRIAVAVGRDATDLELGAYFEGFIVAIGFAQETQRLWVDPWPMVYPDGTRARDFDSGTADYLDENGFVQVGGEIGPGLEWKPRTREEYDADQRALLAKAYARDRGRGGLSGPNPYLEDGEELIAGEVFVDAPEPTDPNHPAQGRPPAALGDSDG